MKHSGIFSKGKTAKILQGDKIVSLTTALL